MTALAAIWSQNWHIGNLTISAGTMYGSWFVMLLLVLFAVVATRQVSVVDPQGAQNVLESVFDFVEGFIGDAADPENAKGLKDLLVTMILFLALSNWLGLIPGLHSPTANLSVPAALAVMVLLMSIFHGIKYKGLLGWIKHFFQPYPLLSPFNILEVFTSTLTHAMRLFGNIFAGELMIGTLAKLLPLKTYFFLLPIVANVVWLAFSLFIGGIQAFVFMMLALVYVGNSMAREAH